MENSIIISFGLFIHFVRLLLSGGAKTCTHIYFYASNSLSLSFNTYHYSCTWFHHFHQYNRGFHPKRPHRNYCGAMSSMVRPSIGQHVDPIFPPMLDNCSNRNRPMHKYNYRQRPSGNSVVVCSLLDMNSIRRSVYRIAQNCSSSWPHRNLRQYKLIHRMSKFPGTIALIRAVLCIAMCLSLDYSIQPLINP